MSQNLYNNGTIRFTIMEPVFTLQTHEKIYTIKESEVIQNEETEVIHKKARS